MSAFPKKQINVVDDSPVETVVIREEVPSLEVQEVKVAPPMVSPFEVAFQRFMSKNEKAIEEITTELALKFLEIG